MSVLFQNLFLSYVILYRNEMVSFSLALSFLWLSTVSFILLCLRYMFFRPSAQTYQQGYHQLSSVSLAFNKACNFHFSKPSFLTTCSQNSALINAEQPTSCMFCFPENLVDTCFRFDIINICQLKHISISSKLLYLQQNYITIYMLSVNSLISFC